MGGKANELKRRRFSNNNLNYNLNNFLFQWTWIGVFFHLSFDRIFRRGENELLGRKQNKTKLEEIVKEMFENI